MSHSLYYGRPVSKNAFPGYSTAELEEDLLSSNLDSETRTNIEAEINRRAEAKKSKRSK